MLNLVMGILYSRSDKLAVLQYCNQHNKIIRYIVGRDGCLFNYCDKNEQYITMSNTLKTMYWPLF